MVNPGIADRIAAFENKGKSESATSRKPKPSGTLNQRTVHNRVAAFENKETKSSRKPKPSAKPSRTIAQRAQLVNDPYRRPSVPQKASAAKTKAPQRRSPPKPQSRRPSAPELLKASVYLPDSIKSKLLSAIHIDYAHHFKNINAFAQGFLETQGIEQLIGLACKTRYLDPKSNKFVCTPETEQEKKLGAQLAYGQLQTCPQYLQALLIMLHTAQTKDLLWLKEVWGDVPDEAASSAQLLHYMQREPPTSRSPVGYLSSFLEKLLTLNGTTTNILKYTSLWGKMLARTRRLMTSEAEMANQEMLKILTKAEPTTPDITKAILASKSRLNYIASNAKVVDAPFVMAAAEEFDQFIKLRDKSTPAAFLSMHGKRMRSHQSKFYKLWEQLKKKLRKGQSHQKELGALAIPYTRHLVSKMLLVQFLARYGRLLPDRVLMGLPKALSMTSIEKATQDKLWQSDAIQDFTVPVHQAIKDIFSSVSTTLTDPEFKCFQ